MQSLKSKIIAILSAIIVLLGGSYAYNQLGGGYQSLDTTKLDGGVAVSTTSPQALAPGSATSTLTMSTKNAESANLKIFLLSTTTPPTLYYTVWFSDDEPVGTTTRNWFAYTGTSDSSDIVETVGSSSKVWQLTYATSTGESLYITRKVDLPTIDSKFTQVRFSISEANADLYVEGVTKQTSN